MSKKRTAEERAGFATGVLNIAIFQIGWSLFKEESWLTYLGFSLMIFAADIVELYKEYPNDADLGKQVRKLILSRYE